MLKLIAGLIPWVDIIKAAPQILSAAKDLLDGAPKPRPEAPEPSHYAEKHSTEESIRILQEEVTQLRQYATELQADSRRQASLIQRIAEHDQQVSVLLEVVRVRLILAMGLAAGSLVGLIICVIIMLK
ncbi:MAG: hypothetical protein Q8O92_07810 [Candidatus Latescibacter sp.]|nr:hypothetical protein [Candidatus Latescibacter sp.]